MKVLKRALAVAIPVIILLAIVAWRYQQKVAADVASKKFSASRKNAATVVEVATARARTISATLSAVGTIESPFTVKLSPNVSGRIVFLEVREGDLVKKGQVLAKLDPSEVEAAILQAQAGIAEAKQKRAQAKIVQASTATGITGAIQQNQALVASTGADYNEVAATYTPTIDMAHEATLDAVNRVQAAQFQLETARQNLRISEANLEDAQAKYTREARLYQTGFAAAQDLDDVLASEKVNEASVSAQQKQVAAAQSLVTSAEAQEQAAANQEAIARKKGVSDLQDARAKLAQSRATLQSAISNRAQIPAYNESLRSLAAAVGAAQGVLQQAVAQRSYLVLRSSISGTVTQRMADPGAEASAGNPILQIQSLDWLYLTATLPVEYSSSVRPGLDATLSVDALPGRTFHSKIVEVNRAADPSVRQFMIRQKLPNGGHLFKPGMYARTSFGVSSVHAPVAVPREALSVNPRGRATVTLVDASSIAHIVPVTTGAEDANFVQIVSGLKEGDKVITLTYRPVKDKAKVLEGTIGGGRGVGSRGTGVQ